MPVFAYIEPGLTLQPGIGTADQVRELQRHLRALGYLKSGIDGGFGPATTRAIKALQNDLLSNHGGSTRNDGQAPVAVADYNHGSVAKVTGVLEQGTAACIAAMMQDDKYPKLPFSSNAKEENRRVVAQLASLAPDIVPMPFLLAILNQESGLKHYCEPSGANEDSFIQVGLDTNASDKAVITSRGYGVGQYTLFHHPPRPDEVNTVIRDAAANVRMAASTLREKFNSFVNGSSAGTCAQDRKAECGTVALRVCRYQATDPRYLKDCRNCLQQAGLVQIQVGEAVYAGSSVLLETTQYYKTAGYSVPDRKNIPCDWPYAVRRYNGAGLDSYHYQFRVLQGVLKLPAAPAAGAAAGINVA